MCTSTTSTSSSLKRGIAIFAAIFSVVLLVVVLHHNTEILSNVHGFNARRLISSAINDALPSPHRKLLSPKRAVKPDRFWGDTDTCSESDIQVSQGPSSPLPSGIPTYTVEIVNACVSGCDIADIHFRCGWFSSARLIDPLIFKRIHFDDCVVNGGKTLGNGESITFQYANTYSYPLSVSSLNCLST